MTDRELASEDVRNALQIIVSARAVICPRCANADCDALLAGIERRLRAALPKIESLERAQLARVA